MKIKLSSLLFLFTITSIFSQNDWQNYKGDGYTLDFPNNWTHSNQKPNPAIKDFFLVLRILMKKINLEKMSI